MIEFQELWKIYTNWIKYVKHTAPKEKLLIFNVKQGIEPLAKFCGKPIPSWKMPYVNDSATFNNAIKMGKNTAMVVYTGNFICLRQAVGLKSAAELDFIFSSCSRSLWHLWWLCLDDTGSNRFYTLWKITYQTQRFRKRFFKRQKWITCNKKILIIKNLSPSLTSQSALWLLSYIGMICCLKSSIGSPTLECPIFVKFNML